MHRSNGKRKYGAGVAALALLAAACGGTEDGNGAQTEVEGTGSEENGSDETYSFRLAGGVAETHPSAQATEDWAERVETLSDGRVEIETIWSGTLLGATEVMPGVRDGRVEIGQSSTSWHPAELPHSYLATVPFLSYDGEAAMRAMNEMYTDDGPLKNEYESQGLHLISFQPLDAVLLGGQEEWTDTSDLSGKQIRAAGDWDAALSAVGAEPVGVPYAEIYESLQRGAIDGYGLNFEGIYDVQLHEVAPYMHDPGVGQITSMNLFISLEEWNGLPDDLQEVMEKAAQGTADSISSLYEEVNSAQCEEMVDSGATFVRWSEEATAEWEETLGDTLIEKWLDSTPDRSEAEEFLERYQSLMDDYSDDSEWNSAFDICYDRQG